MTRAPIPLRSVRKAERTALRWLARAEQARRVVASLSPDDAAIVEAYALECESRADRVLAEVRGKPLAA